MLNIILFRRYKSYFKGYIYNFTRKKCAFLQKKTFDFDVTFHNFKVNSSNFVRKLVDFQHERYFFFVKVSVILRVIFQSLIPKLWIVTSE